MVDAFSIHQSVHDAGVSQRVDRSIFASRTFPIVEITHQKLELSLEHFERICSVLVVGEEHVVIRSSSPVLRLVVGDQTLVGRDRGSLRDDGIGVLLGGGQAQSEIVMLIADDLDMLVLHGLDVCWTDVAVHHEHNQFIEFARDGNDADASSFVTGTQLKVTRRQFLAFFISELANIEALTNECTRAMTHAAIFIDGEVPTRIVRRRDSGEVRYRGNQSVFRGDGHHLMNELKIAFDRVETELGYLMGQIIHVLFERGVVNVGQLFVAKERNHAFQQAIVRVSVGLLRDLATRGLGFHVLEKRFCAVLEARGMTQRLVVRDAQGDLVEEVLGEVDRFSLVRGLGASTNDLALREVTDPPIGTRFETVDDQFLGVSRHWRDGLWDRNSLVTLCAESTGRSVHVVSRWLRHEKKAKQNSEIAHVIEKSVKRIRKLAPKTADSSIHNIILL